MSLSNDEVAVLMIAARGEYMLAIGRWASSITQLFGKGLLRKDFINGGPQYTITDAGREALADNDNKEDKLLGKLIEEGSRVGSLQKTAMEAAEQAAQALTACTRATVEATGDGRESAARRWADVVLRRALELLNG